MPERLMDSETDSGRSKVLKPVLEYWNELVNIVTSHESTHEVAYDAYVKLSYLKSKFGDLSKETNGRVKWAAIKRIGRDRQVKCCKRIYEKVCEAHSAGNIEKAKELIALLKKYHGGVNLNILDKAGRRAVLYRFAAIEAGLVGTLEMLSSHRGERVVVHLCDLAHFAA